MVCGGMHLLQHSDAQVGELIEQLKQLGVKRAGATHCTGDRAIKMFREAFGKDYVPLGAGRAIQIDHDFDDPDKDGLPE